MNEVATAYIDFHFLRFMKIGAFVVKWHSLVRESFWKLTSFTFHDHFNTRARRSLIHNIKKNIAFWFYLNIIQLIQYSFINVLYNSISNILWWSEGRVPRIVLRNCEKQTKVPKNSCVDFTEKAWDGFQDYVKQACDSINGRGLYFDIHGHTHSNRTELGWALLWGLLFLFLVYNQLSDWMMGPETLENMPWYFYDK